MPRLIGKQTNSDGYIALLLLAAVGAVGVMEYTGVIDIIPHFGKDYLGQPDLSQRDGYPNALKPLKANQPIAHYQPLQQSITQFSVPATLSNAV